MQIFTTEMTLELLYQIKETSNLLFESILSAAWNNTIDSFGSIISAISSQDWSGVLVGVFMAISGAILLYKLVRDNILSTLEFLLKK